MDRWEHLLRSCSGVQARAEDWGLQVVTLACLQLGCHVALYTMTNLVAQLILRLLQFLQDQHRTDGPGPEEAVSEDTCTISTDAVSSQALSDDSDFGAICSDRLAHREALYFPLT